MDKVVAYLLEKETITGAEMVAIIEGRDPALANEAYGSTLSAGERTPGVEAPAKKVHMISQKIEAPEDTPAPEDGPSPDGSVPAPDGEAAAPAPEEAPASNGEPAEPPAPPADEDSSSR